MKMNGYTYLLSKARILSNMPVVQKLIKIRLVELFARKLQSRLLRRAYAEIAKERAKGPSVITVSGISAIIRFPTNSDYFCFLEDSSERIFLTHILENTTCGSVFYDIGANIG